MALFIDKKALQIAVRSRMGVRCERGQASNYGFPDKMINDYGWHAKNSQGMPHNVGKLKANPYGIFDMNGNVAEWVEDCFHENYRDAPLDGKPWVTGPYCNRRVVRGGDWLSDVSALRSASRDWEGIDDDSSDTVGFRIAREANVDPLSKNAE